MEKASSLLNRVFYALFGFCFLWLFLNVILNVQTTNFSDLKLISIFNPFLIVLFSAFLFAVLFMISLFFFPKKEKSNRSAFTFLGVIMLVMIAVQLVFGYQLALVTVGQDGTDFGVMAGAAHFLGANKPYLGDYFYKFPYQNGALALLTISYKFWLLFGIDHFNFAAMGINLISIDASMVLVFLTVRKIFDNNKACFSLLLCAFFLPFYTYIPYYYTDTLSMPYAVLIVYFYIMAYTSTAKKKRWIFFGLMGIAAAVGYWVKGSSAIVLVAVIVHLILTRYPIRKVLSVCFSFVVMVCCILVLHAEIDASGWFGYKQSEAGSIPLIHYLMVGLNDERYGAWNQTDYHTTFEVCTTKEQRTQMAIEVIKQRLQNYGADGYIKFLTKKSTWEWGDGTYFAPAVLGLPHLRDSVLHQWFLFGGAHYKAFAYYSQVFQVCLLFFILCSIRKRIKIKPDFMLLINLSVFGIFLFLLLWEARSRYLLNFAPLILISATDGFFYLDAKIKDLLYKKLKGSGGNTKIG